MNLVKAAEIYLQKSFVQVSESEEFLAIGFKEVNEIIGSLNDSFLSGSSGFSFFYFQILKINGGKLKEISPKYIKLFGSVVDPDPHGLDQKLDP